MRTSRIVRRQFSSIAVVFAVLGCGGDGGGTGAGGNAVSIPQQIAFEDAPAYAVGYAEAFSPELYVLATYSPCNLTVSQKDGEGHVRIALVSAPQGIALGKDANGKRFVLATTVDFETHESKLILVRDDDGNLLPEEDETSNLGAVQNSHLVRIAFDEASTTLYALDARNDRILRFNDSNNDGVPDVATMTVFVSADLPQAGPLGAVYIDEPTATAVESIVKGRAPSLRGVLTRFEDTDSDGAADSSTELARTDHRGLESRTNHGAIPWWVRGGDTSVQVYLPAGTLYEVLAVSSGGASDVLATFTSVAGVQTVGLSRAIATTESIELRVESSGDRVAGAGVIGADDLVISGSTFDGSVSKIPSPGDTIAVQGSGFAGTEEFDVASLTDGTLSWLACTVETSSTILVEIELPTTLPIGPEKRAVVRVRRGTDVLWYLEVNLELAGQ